MFSKEEILIYNKQGLFPGPNESDEDFMKRVSYCLNLRKNLSIALKEQETEEKSKEILAEAYPITLPLYGIAPAWVPLYFSNEKLAPWHGGCAWIFQMTEESPTAAFFQLRKAWYASSYYLGIYSRKEFLAHEISHIGRMVYQEPRFEELLAYRTSTTSLRRWLGPIVRNARESLLFVLFVLAAIVSLFFAFYSNNQLFYEMALWLQVIILSLVTFGLYRVWQDQRTFSRCCERLQELVREKEQVNAVVYRLTDKEIADFADMDSKAILQYAVEQSQKSLRWQVIGWAYLK